MILMINCYWLTSRCIAWFCYSHTLHISHICLRIIYVAHWELKQWDLWYVQYCWFCCWHQFKDSHLSVWCHCSMVVVASSGKQILSRSCQEAYLARLWGISSCEWVHGLVPFSFIQWLIMRMDVLGPFYVHQCCRTTQYVLLVLICHLAP